MMDRLPIHPINSYVQRHPHPLFLLHHLPDLQGCNHFHVSYSLEYQLGHFGSVSMELFDRYRRLMDLIR